MVKETEEMNTGLVETNAAVDNCGEVAVLMHWCCYQMALVAIHVK